jgi:hypothetical protein
MLQGDRWSSVEAQLCRLTGLDPPEGGRREEVRHDLEHPRNDVHAFNQSPTSEVCK